MGFGWVSLYLLRMGMGPILHMLIEEFNISYATAGLLFSAIFCSYSAMQLPSGYLGDRFGRKKILIIGTFLWFVLSLVTAVAQTFRMLVVVRFLTGIAHGVYFGNDRPTIIAFTPRGKMGQEQAISLIGLAFGFFLSVFLSGIIADYFQSWRFVFIVFSVPSLVTCLLLSKYVREPSRSPSDGGEPNPKPLYRQVFLNRDLWLMYLLGATILFAL